jgi:neurofibromin 1
MTNSSLSLFYRYNPALQPRGLVVFGCIAKSITDHDVKQLLRILVKALESFSDITLIEAIVMCLTRLQPLLRPESPIHKALFWVSISILQLDEIQLYASGLALLEQNLLTLESQGAFDLDMISTAMLATREPLEWYFKQLDHSVGLSFKSNFHFALVGHLIKGYRHLSSVTVSRTTRILSMLLDIVAKPTGRDKYEVTVENVAYLAALVSVSEDVRSRCHVKHNFSDVLPDSPTFDSFAVDNHLKGGGAAGVAAAAAAGGATGGGGQKRPPSGLALPVQDNYGQQQPQHSPSDMRQKSLEMMEQPPELGAITKRPPGTGRLEKRSNSIPGKQQSKSPNPGDDGASGQASETDSGSGGEETVPIDDLVANANASTDHSDVEDDDGDRVDEDDTDAGRPSISNENNILLDPDVLNDQVIQVLVLTVMATLVKYTTDESEVRILYEYLAEASIVFPKVFPVIHSLLDAKITTVLSLCHDKTILAAVQSIIENMIACEDDKSQQQLHYLQSCGFGGLWRFAGPFTQANCNAENVELFLNTLEALVETCLIFEDQEENISYNSLLSVSSNIKMTSSLTSLSLASPTEQNAPSCIDGTSQGLGASGGNPF